MACWMLMPNNCHEMPPICESPAKLEHTKDLAKGRRVQGHLTHEKRPVGPYSSPMPMDLW